MAYGYNNAANAYRNNTVNYASKDQLLLMLLDGAVKFTKRAIVSLEENNLQESHENNVKVQSIFYELIASLDLNLAGEWGKNMSAIYNFIIKRLTEANIKKDVEIIKEVLPLIEEINDTWNQAYNISKNNG